MASPPGTVTWRVSTTALALTCLLSAASLAASSNPDHVSRPPTKAEARELLKSICPNGIRPYHIGSASRLGCSPCPRFTTWGSIGRLSGQGLFGLQAVIYGSFSTPGATEAVGDFDGCEDHASTANFNASVFFRKTAGEWRMVDYIRTETTKCRLDPLPGGRDILVCQGFSGHPEESEEWIFSLEFFPSGGWRENDLFGVANTWGACGPTAIAGSISKFELLDLNHDGVPDLRITAAVGREAHGGKLGVCAGNYKSKPPKIYRIDFLFKDGTFVVAPWSTKTKDTLDQTFKAAVQKALAAY
ncbi:MAG: hypothetical protein P8Z30_13310 [Acidobacteriota bacterium]